MSVGGVDISRGGNTMAKSRIEFTGGIPEAATDLLVGAIHKATGGRIPKPIIYGAVKLVLLAASSIERSDVAAILTRLGVPGSLLARVWTTFTGGAEGLCAVECPESGDTIWHEEGDGTFACPDCGQDILVQDGEAFHDMLTGCPVKGVEFWVPPVEDTYPCPECGMDVVVADGDVEHEEPAACARSRRAVPKKSTKKAKT
jgi:predicted RNA-binding Zn-ribbon protein involved in translation (DUF1610 family)